MLVPSQNKVGGLQLEWHLAKKWGDDGHGSLISLDRVATSRMAGVSSSVIFPCTMKV